MRDVERSKAWFKRHGGAAVYIGRLVPGVRAFVSLPAGFAKMSRLPFLLYSAAGTIVWTAALAYAGVILKANFAAVENTIGTITNMLLIGVGVMMVRRYLQCWRGSRRQSARPTSG